MQSEKGKRIRFFPGHVFVGCNGGWYRLRQVDRVMVGTTRYDRHGSLGSLDWYCWAGVIYIDCIRADVVLGIDWTTDPAYVNDR
jgi:hypothetical protein